MIFIRRTEAPLQKNVTVQKEGYYTKNISKKLTLDIQKHDVQFESITVEPFNLSYDRFMIIDNAVYHIGASLKDFGKAWFAFTKMNDISAEELLNRIK